MSNSSDHKRERLNAAQALDETLPELAYFFHELERKIIIIKSGQMGYHDVPAGKISVHSAETAMRLNAPLKITPAQAMAMKLGSMMGFHVPGARTKAFEDRFCGRDLLSSDLVI